MEHLEGLGTVITEDVGVVMDQRGVGSHVRPHPPLYFQAQTDK